VDHLPPEEVCRLIGELLLNHRLELLRQQTVYEARLKQAEARLADQERQLGTG
jgi:hypothetical protein